jgi:photosystem II stability/assembly factor-like uncharacterized protein
MKFETIFCFLLVLGAAFFAGCASTHPVVMPNCQINDIHMFNGRDGWAEAYSPSGYLILKTTDGARDWKNVTPSVTPLRFPYNIETCEFATRKTAWVTINTNGWIMLMTTNSGSSWWQVGASFHYFSEASNVRFVNDKYGVAQVGDGGLGSVYYSFYQTRDGGLNWTPIAVTLPNSIPDETGSVHLSNYNGDKVAYYPRKTFIIAYGESGDFAPNGYIRLSISTELGKSWRPLRLPLPDGQGNEYAEPLLPEFFGERDGVLPVELFTQSNDLRTFHKLLFYRTVDGGETWSVSGAVGISKTGLAGNDCDVISSADIVVRNDGVLNVTCDAGKTWVGILPNIDLGREDPKSRRDMVRMDFVDADHGWMIVSDYTKSWPYDHYSFFRTKDGGKNWTEVPLRISQ